MEVQNAASSSGSTASLATNKMNDMKMEDFLKIMVKELQQQDPFEPMSSQELVNQVSTLRDMQSSMALSDTLENLSVNQQLSAASSMIGKIATGLTTDGGEISGLVTGVKVKDKEVFLELDSGHRLSLDNVMSVHNEQEAPAESQS